MEVLFAGICLWEKKSSNTELLGLMPNGRNGGVHGGHTIPPHTAGVIVEEGEVDAANWPQAPQPITIRGVPHLLFELDGDDVSFDPPPNGGALSITQLPSLGCATNKVVRPSVTGNAPSKSAVVARIHIPRTARMGVVPNQHGAQFARVMMSDTTQLVSKSFSGVERRLTFLGTNPTVTVANIDLASALAPNPNTAEEHGHLYCPLFINENTPETAPAGLAFNRSSRSGPNARTVLAGLGGRRGTQLTIGPGCSNTQWP